MSNFKLSVEVVQFVQKFLTKSKMFLNVTPCSLKYINLNIREALSSVLKKGVAKSSEVSTLSIKPCSSFPTDTVVSVELGPLEGRKLQ
jgi:hypothetical protein